MTAAPPPPPWLSEVDAVLWWHRAAPGTRARLEAGGLRTLPAALGGLVAYREGPVGPYGEVFCATAVVLGRRVAGHAAFMAVDSAASVAGGRDNWALPKELAVFTGDGGRPGRVTACGRGWSVTVRARRRPRDVPARVTARCAQRWPDGAVRAFTVTMRGRARLGSVDVDVEGDEQPGGRAAAQALAHADVGPGPASGSATGSVGLPPGALLRAGRHPAVFLSGIQVVGPPRPPAQRSASRPGRRTRSQRKP